MDDAQLATAAAGGDRAALAALAVHYRRYVYAIAWRILRDEEEALDAAQDTLERLARRIGQWRGEGNFRGWLAAIAVHAALDRRRSSARRREVGADAGEMEALGLGRPVAVGACAADPRAAAVAGERREMVAAAMRKLSAQQRALLELRLGEGMQPAEIAERLGMPPAQVRSQICRGIARLREMLGEET